MTVTIGGTLIAAGFLRMDRRLAFAGGSALFMVALIVMALSPSYWLALGVLGFFTGVPEALVRRSWRAWDFGPGMAVTRRRSVAC